MKNLILKMVGKGVISAENANKIMMLGNDYDPIWTALHADFIDEKKLASFYEYEGYPVINEEGINKTSFDYFNRLFTPDTIVRYMAFPISFKKESKDVIIAFLNSELIEDIKYMINRVFPDFNTTFFYLPYTTFKEIVLKEYLFDIELYMTNKIADKNLFEKSEIADVKSDLLSRFRDSAEKTFLFDIEENSIISRNLQTQTELKLATIPFIKNTINIGAIEFELASIASRLSTSERLLIINTLGAKGSDKITFFASQEEKFLFILINAKPEVMSLLKGSFDD